MHADFAAVGRALAAPARSVMVSVLLDGQPHTAGELARAAGVASSTASGHLAVLVGAGIVTASHQGRFHRFQITDGQIAAALESLGRPSDTPATSLRLSREQRRVRAARTCYDHLAGQLGVAVARLMIERGWCTPALDEVLPAGAHGLAELGIDVPGLRLQRRPLIRACLDWTERVDHAAGGVGAALAATALHRGWVTRIPASRGLRITPTGSRMLDRLGIRGRMPG
jgi:DNA-binding transcriptional ArsR family regulator